MVHQGPASRCKTQHSGLRSRPPSAQPRSGPVVLRPEEGATRCQIEDIDERSVLLSCAMSAILFTRQEGPKGQGALDQQESGV